MLKKNDLAKQFELVVQQEIKNYNDSLSAINSKLNSLSAEINNVEQKMVKNNATVCSQIKSLEIEIQKIKCNLEFGQKKLESKTNDQDVKLENHKKSLFTLHELEKKNAEHLNELLRKIQFLSDDLKNVFHLFSKTERHFCNELTAIEFKLNKNIFKAKEEILSQPSEAHKVRKDLEEKISSHSLDVNGIMKEIRFSRHDMMVMEKKIENIYTLIERLQKAKVNP